MSGFKTVDEVSALIKAGKALSLGGVAELLEQLPQGQWIGGTSPYFMAVEGGVIERERIFVEELPELLTASKVQTYGPEDLESIPKDGFGNGFSVMVLPAFSEAHLQFAKDAPDIPGIFNKPLIGWVTGVHLDELGSVTPAVYDGTTGTRHENAGIVLHVELPESHGAVIDIINLFKPGNGPTLTFETDGWEVENVLVDGEKKNFAEYCRSIEHDVRLPLVVETYGSGINPCLQGIPEDDSAVKLYAPVFRGLEYRFADQLEGDYKTEFMKALKIETEGVCLGYNCVLNFVYSELEGVELPIGGPVTFGEIAYQLLNQTLAILKIVKT